MNAHKTLLTLGILTALLLPARATVVVGSNHDVTDSPYGGRFGQIQFVPLSCPQRVGTNTIWPTTAVAKITGGLFSTNLVGGFYVSSIVGDLISGTRGKTVNIYVPPNDANVWQFNDCAALATNIPPFRATFAPVLSAASMQFNPDPAVTEITEAYPVLWTNNAGTLELRIEGDDSVLASIDQFGTLRAATLQMTSLSGSTNAFAAVQGGQLIPQVFQAGPGITLSQDNAHRTFSISAPGLIGNSTNIFLPSANTNVLVLSGFGPGLNTLTNDGNGGYISGGIIDATGANGTYYWNATGQSYTNPSNGYGFYYDGATTSVAWLTNATHPLALDTINGTGSGVAVLDQLTSDHFSGMFFEWPDGGTIYPGALSAYAFAYSAPAFVGTSLSPGVSFPSSNTYNGSFTGNLAGGSNLSATAIAPFTLSVSNMDNATWLGWLSGQFSAQVYSNWNRFGTTNTFAAIAKKQPLTVLFQGNGYVNEGGGAQFDWELECLTNLFGVRGFIGNPYSVYGTGAQYAPISTQWSASSGVGLGGRDTNWWPGYMVMTNNNAGLKLNPNYAFACDTFEVDWVSTSKGGTFTLSTNNGSGWHVLTTLQGNTSVQTGNAFKWTNATLSTTMQIAFTNTSAGTNNLVTFGFFNSTLTNGVTFMQQGQQATSPSQLEDVASSVRAPIYRSWNPNLIFDIWTVSDAQIPFYVAGRDFYRTNNPGADVVQCWQCLVGPGTVHDVVGDDATPLSVARTNGFVFFNGTRMGGDNYTLGLRGLLAGDNGHLSTAGYDFYGKLLWNFLGLTERH